MDNLTGRVLNDSSASLLLRDGDMLFKYCRPQRFPKDYLRRYFGYAQARRELRGARRLKRIGVRCATPYAAFGIWLPWAQFESVLVSEFVENRGTAEAVLAALDPDSPEHQALCAAIGRDVGSMARSGLLFRDLHLGNILIGLDGAPCWIDTDVSRQGRRRAVEANRRALGRLLQKGRGALRDTGTARLVAIFEATLAA